ncbi:MAG TPA: molybdopterin-dependent oxidoreductase, partial [Solirubrobacteraceae bacterium]|nr:molybdopterin-dependent oxidoreductase [Solirubrobacteraceae bacterium]
PKLQTACSTAVKDGMVVHTQTERVREGQQAVVEFLLVNHPLDCPVCDKGGECPLQDITYGWGGGTSRFIEPKRHFRKPLELSPLIAIDRERCILCYRCVRFSQEISEDYQLVLLERGAHSLVATFEGHPYVGPFSGNIIELCPVGALTSRAYRFRARPWEVEGAGSVCTMCPAQCNVEFTVRDERVLRVLARDHPDVDDGWLCDKGRFAYQSVHSDDRVTEPLLREGGELRPVSWERALDEAVGGLRRAKGRVGALAGGGASNEDGFLLGRLMREALESPHLDSGLGGALPLGLRRALDAPGLAAAVPDLEYADAVLVLDCEPMDDAPILDLRIRKGVRRHGVRLAVATSRPSSLDPHADVRLRYAPGAHEAVLVALDAALSRGGDLDAAARAAGTDRDQVAALAALLGEAGDEVVVLWGERLCGGPRGANAARALLNLAARLGMDGRDGAGLLEIPTWANGRGLREAGVLPNAGPGLSEPSGEGMAAGQIAGALGEGELTALYLLGVDPLSAHPARGDWESALSQASFVVAHTDVLSQSLAEHADVVIPAEAYPEKEGTVTHPDGRVQRLRPAIGRPAGVHADWQVLAELSERLGHPLEVRSGPMATAALVESIPFYRGLTLDELGGHGVRWPRGEAVSAFPAGDAGPFELESPPQAPDVDGGGLRLGTFRSLWSSPEVSASPILQFLVPRQRAELSPGDAERIGVQDGETVEVAYNGTSLRATAALRAAVPPGSVFLAEATEEEPANTLTGLEPRVVEVRRR